MERVDSIIRGEFLIIRPDAPPIMDGAVAIKGDRIVDVLPWSECKVRYKGENLINRPSGLVMPGLINTHTHAAMTLFRGLADDLPLKTWLEEHIFPVEARLTPELVSLGTELACAEMIRCGTTSFVDMYLFEDSVASVVDRVGMRAWLGEGIFDFPSPAFSSGYEALAKTERLMEKWGGHSRITITVDPHAPYTCSPELLIQARKLAERKGAITVIHLSETEWEYGEIKRHYGVRPTVHLDNLGMLSENLLAVHCVWLNNDDIAFIADRDVKISHCPESNQKLGCGIAPVPELINAGVSVSLGTDGAASNNDLDILSELDSAAKVHKGQRKDPTVVSASEALSMSTTWAAYALHRTDIGRLEKGAKADIVVLDLDQVHLQPCFNPVSQVVYVARGGDVQDVMVDGRLLMLDRELTTIDEKSLLKRLKKAISELRSC